MDDRTCCNCGLGASSIYSPALPCGCSYCYVCEGRGRHEDHPWSECEGPEGADPAATLASKRAWIETLATRCGGSVTWADAQEVSE